MKGSKKTRISIRNFSIVLHLYTLSRNAVEVIMGCVNGNTNSINDEEKRQSIGTCSSEESTVNTAMKRLSIKKTEGEEIPRNETRTSSISTFIVSAILEASNHVDLGMNKNDHLIS
jgi:hypothetical protein